MTSKQANQKQPVAEEEIHRLILQLCQLAIDWRGKEVRKESGQEKIVSEYHSTIHQLESLGWDGNIPLEAVLPFEFLPEPYSSVLAKRAESGDWTTFVFGFPKGET